MANKEMYVRAGAVDVMEEWPSGEITLHMRSGQKVASSPNQEIEDGLVDRLKDEMFAIRGEDIEPTQTDGENECP